MGYGKLFNLLTALEDGKHNIVAHRRSGKTSAAVKFAVNWARTRESNHILYVVHTQEMGHIVCNRILESLNTPVRWTRYYAGDTIFTETDSIIHIRTARQVLSARLTIQPDLTIVDEAELLSDLEMMAFANVLDASQNAFVMGSLPYLSDEELKATAYYKHLKRSSWSLVRIPVTQTGIFTDREMGEFAITAGARMWRRCWMCEMPSDKVTIRVPRGVEVEIEYI